MQSFGKVVVHQGYTLSIVMNNDTSAMVSDHIFQRHEPEEMSGDKEVWSSDERSPQLELDLYQTLFVANFEWPIWNRQRHFFTKKKHCPCCICKGAQPDN